MPWKVTETDIREYFSKFGELVMVQLKKDSKSKQPKGYGFIRFASYDDQMKALNEECHLIGGRRCEVKFPNSKEEPASQLPYKVFLLLVTMKQLLIQNLSWSYLYDNVLKYLVFF